MKGLIRKEWYSLWSQYRIHMLAMFGLGILLPIIKNTDFFFDESLWMYCVGITIFYILVHSIEYEKTSKWGMYRVALPIKGRERVFSKYIFGFVIMLSASILLVVGSTFCQMMIMGRIDTYFIRPIAKNIWFTSTVDMTIALPILCRYGYDEGGSIVWPIICIMGFAYPLKIKQFLLNLPFSTIAFFILLFIIWCFSGALSCKLYENRSHQ